MNIYVHIYIGIIIYIYIQLHIFTHIYIHICQHVKRACTLLYLVPIEHICTYRYICVYTHDVHIYSLRYVYIYIYIYTHISTSSAPAPYVTSSPSHSARTSPHGNAVPKVNSQNPSCHQID